MLLTSSWYAGSSWGAEASDAEAWDYYNLAVEAERSGLVLPRQPAIRHTEQSWTYLYRRWVPFLLR